MAEARVAGKVPLVSPTYLAPGIYLEEQPAGSRPIQGVGTAVAAFLGVTETGPVGTPVPVANWTAFRSTFGDVTPGCHLPRAVYGFFQNGGGICFVVRVGDGRAGPVARAALPSAEDEKTSSYEVTTAGSAPADGMSVEVEPPAEGDPSASFSLVVRSGDRELERFDGLTAGEGAHNAVMTVNERSQLIRLAAPAGGAPAPRPADGTVALGTRGRTSPPAPQDYVGDAVARTGLAGLEAVDEITMIAAPDLVAPQDGAPVDLDAVRTVQGEMVAHCDRLRDRMAILDTPPGLTAQAAQAWRTDHGFDSPFAVLYWPWVRVPGAPGEGPVAMPPSGHVAGVWARSDAQRGVHKAPANEALAGVLDVERQVTQEEQKLLNPVGVNAIRAFPARGVRIWGARTLAPADSEWRYVNVRRLLNYLEESIVEGTQWVVFEPNDQRLWQRISRTVSAFLTMAWRDGALFGARPEQAFYVKCDAETNPPPVVDAGQVVIEIGVAPVRPAEFVVFRVAQLAGDGQANE